MREALAGLVKINELHNQAVVAVIGKPGGWKDYLNDAARRISQCRGDGMNFEVFSTEAEADVRHLELAAMPWVPLIQSFAAVWTIKWSMRHDA